MMFTRFHAGVAVAVALLFFGTSTVQAQRGGGSAKSAKSAKSQKSELESVGRACQQVRVRPGESHPILFL